jgi:hypothetical protein
VPWGVFWVGGGGVMGLGLMADRYQVDVVQVVVEEAVMRLLTVESCGTMLALSTGSGLLRVEGASRELARREFDDFARTEGFMKVGDEVLGSLLEDDELCTEREERVYEGVVRWIKGGEGGAVRGLGLLRKVRFPLMEEGYLAGLSREECGKLAGLMELVEEAVGLQSVGREEWGRQRLRHLDDRSVVERCRLGVRWEEYVGGGGEEYVGGGERRLDVDRGVYSVAAYGVFVCGGLEDGRIQVWNSLTLEQDRTLTGHGDTVWALLFVGGRLVSGSDDRCIRVWDVAAGRCEGVLEGHAERVTALASDAGRLLSGSLDGTVRVWTTGGGPSCWRCERALGGRGPGVWCVVGWGGGVACGCGDGGIRVWSSETWALERTLRGHTEGLDVIGLAVSGRRLVSSGRDGTVRVWSTETWVCVQTAEAYPGWRRYIRPLAVCGSALVGGAYMADSRWCEVRVWDLETLAPLHRLAVLTVEGDAGAADGDSGEESDGGAARPAVVWSLVCCGREVWAAVGTHVVLWGRRG